MEQGKKKNNNPTLVITILIPVYQGERYIRKSIESILNQTYSNLQLIIMDDGSTDSTKEIIDSFHDHRIEYHYRKVRKGYPYHDDMFEFIRGDYVTFQAHDDLSLPERLKVLVGCMAEDPLTDAIFERSELIDENDNPTADWALEFAFQNPAETQEEVLHFMFAGHALPGAIFLKTSFLFAKLGGTLELKGYEAAPDYATNFEILKLGKVRIINKVLTRYRFHRNNYSKTKMNTITEAAARIISKNRRELLIEQIFPQILKATSEKERRRLYALCHFQLAMYMNRYGAFRFVRELVERDLELAIAADPALAPAWNALGTVRWQSAMDYAVSSHEALKTACKLAGNNPEFLTNLKTIAGRIGQDTALDKSPLNLQESLNKHLRIKTLWDAEIKKITDPAEEKSTSPEEKDSKTNRPKILIISSFYPPHHLSDEDLLCQKLYHTLSNENYSVKVITSDFIAPSYQKFGLFPIPCPEIYRDL